jgi:SAM-dependent methyltransferase
MLALSPSLDAGDARFHLDTVISRPLPAAEFRPAICTLHRLFGIFAATSPTPLPSPGLILTQEIRRQCELYLPVSRIADSFSRLYRTALTYPPILESTPFHTALSWADVFSALPPRFQSSSNPACLLEELVNDPELLTVFLFESFLPRRFYGGFRRYPGQMAFINAWLSRRPDKELRCLDAACGTGEDSYGLALLLIEKGFRPDDFWIEGWTIEPLEVLAAAHAIFPHDPERQADYRSRTEPVFNNTAADRILFRTIDLKAPPNGEVFDLILCNGLLGGPIINRPDDVRNIVAGLSGILSPGGMLLAADSFHDGWKKNIPGETLGDVFASCGLSVSGAGEGICGLAPQAGYVR